MSPRLRPRQVLGLILLAFVVVIAGEIAVAVLVARLIGPWPTLLLIVAWSFAGLLVVRRGGARSVLALRQAALERRLPGGEMADAVMLLVGGVLMIPPGLVLDVLGLLFVLPFTRPLVRRLCGAFLRVGVIGRIAQSFPTRTVVIQGEVVDLTATAVDPEPPRPQDQIGPGPA